MPLLNGIEATQQITAKESPTKVVILSMHSGEDYVLRTLKAGARAYILKNSAEAAAGPTVAGGMLFAGSGYPGVAGGMGGNVLLAFGVE